MGRGKSLGFHSKRENVGSFNVCFIWTTLAVVGIVSEAAGEAGRRIKEAVAIIQEEEKYVSDSRDLRQASA